MLALRKLALLFTSGVYPVALEARLLAGGVARTTFAHTVGRPTVDGWPVALVGACSMGQTELRSPWLLRE